MSDTADRVKKIVVEHLNVDGDKVVEAASFIEDLGADSLDTVELVMAFEEEFGIEIPDDAAESIVTVGDAEKVTDSASFIEDLGADSLDTVELVMAFEEEFGIEIPDDAAESIVTVGDAVKYIDKANA